MKVRNLLFETAEYTVSGFPITTPLQNPRPPPLEGWVGGLEDGVSVN